MATSDSGSKSLTGHDRFLIEKTEEAIRDGSQLAQWCRQQDRSLALFPVALNKTYRLPNRPECFFGSVGINGQSMSVMGTRQEVELLAAFP